MVPYATAASLMMSPECPAKLSAPDWVGDFKMFQEYTVCICMYNHCILIYAIEDNFMITLVRFGWLFIQSDDIRTRYPWPPRVIVGADDPMLEPQSGRSCLEWHMFYLIMLLFL